MSDEKLVPKLRFAGFTEEWNNYYLCDVIESFVNGQTPSRNVDSYWNGDIPWVSSGELNYNHITSTIEQITEEGKKNANLKLIPSGTFLIAITGLEAAGTRGSCAILDIDATTNQSCMALFPKKENLTTKFLYYWYLKVGEHYGIKYTQGTKQQSYNKELLEKLPINLPNTLEEQNKITDFLSSLNRKIELLNKKHDYYVNFKKYLMQQIFAQKLRFDYEEYTLKDVCEHIGNGFSGTQVTYKTSFPVTRIETISSGNINYDRVGFVDQIPERYLLKEGDILLTNINSMKWIGNSVYYDGKQKLYHGMNLMLLRTKKEFNSKYLYYYITYYNNWFKRMACQAVNQASINKSTLEKFIIKFPKIEEQNNISNALSSADIKIDQIMNEIELTKKFKKGLLQQMFV